VVYFVCDLLAPGDSCPDNLAHSLANKPTLSNSRFGLRRDIYAAKSVVAFTCSAFRVAAELPEIRLRKIEFTAL
jgi:hypothetical protein